MINKVTTLIILILVATNAAFIAAQAQSSEPIAVGHGPHLFIDEFLIDQKTNVTLTVNPPQRKELVMIADKPWERGGITSYGNVFWDPKYKEYRFYYVPVHLDSNPIFMLCMATSKDGIHWNKPNLGAVEWQGSTKNNIVIRLEREGTVIFEPNAPPETRYAIISSHPEFKTRLYTSPDGIHWKVEKTVWQHHSDSQISTFWHDRLGKYVHYPRISHQGRATGRVETATMDEAWPEQLPVVLSRDKSDPEGLDLYTNAAQKYALAKDVYLAFPTPYYHYNHPGRTYLNEPTLRIGGKTNDGTIDTQLAVSRDGVKWTRYRTPYVPLYNHEGIDLKLTMMYQGMLYHDTHLNQYFGGYALTHGDTQARRRLQGRDLGGIFRVEQRIDGFCSLDFDYTGGTVVTKPFTFAGSRLTLNINTSASGEGRVAILDAEGDEIPGYGLADARFINGNYLEKVVEWHDGNSDVSSLAGKPVQLRFECRGTKLYSFRFKD